MVTGVEIAEKMHIPSSYLLTIMGKLRTAGFISVKRGTTGGYRLAKPKQDISLWDIMELMEGTMRINRCLEKDGYCNLGDAQKCRLRHAYCMLQEKLESCFQSVTLETVTERLYWSPNPTQKQMQNFLS
jgi:Rrf2 family nitric oxide-sensitive transcriptional repressor